jgi:hypothetical protein
VPKKNSKKHRLTAEEKTVNGTISEQRIIIENVIGDPEKFRILSDSCRCRRRRFRLRFNLIAGIYSRELG